MIYARAEILQLPVVLRPHLCGLGICCLLHAEESQHTCKSTRPVASCSQQVAVSIVGNDLLISSSPAIIGSPLVANHPLQCLVFSL